MSNGKKVVQIFDIGNSYVNANYYRIIESDAACSDAGV
jgi:hypothetical protein